MKILRILIINLFVVIMVKGEEKKISSKDLILAYQIYNKASHKIDLLMNEVLNDSYLKEEINFLTKNQIIIYKESRDLLLKSIELNPFHPDVYLYLGNSFWDIENDHEKTLEYFQKALDIYPLNEDILIARITLLINLKKFELAKNDLEKLKEIGSIDYLSQLNAFNLARE